MSTIGNRALKAVALAFALLGVGGAAWAFFAASGSGSGNAATGTLGGPSAVTASASGSTVALSWTAPPGLSPTGYYVQRSAGTAAGTCASSAGSPLAGTSTSCSDTGVATGSYTYTVVAVLGGWTSSATSNSATVAPSVLDHFQVTAPASAVAGSPINATVTAKDASDATLTSYSGSHTLAWSGPGPAPSGAAPTYPTSVTFSGGVGTAVVTLVQSETTTLTSSEGAISGTSASIAVSGAAASQFVVAAPTPQTAGTAFNVTVTAQDTFKNAASGYSGAKTLTWSGAAAAPNGTAPAYQSALTFSSGGVATASTTLMRVETAALSATQGSITGTSGPVVVNHGAATQFVVSASTPQVAGTQFTVGIAAQDAFKNPATSYTGPMSIIFTGPAGSPSGTNPTYPASVSFSAGTGSALVTLAKAETATLTATLGGTTGSSTGIVVNAGAAARLAWSSPTSTGGTPSSPCIFICTVNSMNNKRFSGRVAVTDALGNTVSSIGSGHSVTLSSNGAGTFSGSVLLTISSTGAAVSTTTFTFNAQGGNWTPTNSETITAAKSAGTSYTSATATINK